MIKNNPVNAYQHRMRIFRTVTNLVLLCMAAIYLYVLHREGAINRTPGSLILKTGYYIWSFDWRFEDILNVAGCILFLLVGIHLSRLRLPGSGIGYSSIFIFGAVVLCGLQVTGGVGLDPPGLITRLCIALLAILLIYRLIPPCSGPLSILPNNWLRDVTGFFMGCAVAVFSWRMIYGGNEVITDAQSQIVQARMLASGNWVLPMSQAMCDIIEFPNPVFTPPVYSQYPPGYILALIPMVLLDWPVHLLNVFLSGILVVLTGRLAQRSGGVRASWIAVFLMVTSPFFLGMSGTGMNHSLNAVLLLGVASLLIPMSRPLQSREAWRRGLFAGMLLGWAVTTRPLTAVAHSAGWLVIWIVMLAFAGSAGGLRRRDIRRQGLWVMAGLVPAAIVFMLYNFKTTGNPFTLAYQLSNPDLHQVGFWDSNELDFGPVDALHHMAANIFALNWILFGWPIGSMVVLCIWWFRTRFSRPEICMVALIAVQSTLYAAYQFHDLLLGPRFLYDLFPMLVILSSMALAGMTRGRPTRLRVLWAVIILFAVGGMISSYAHWSARFIRPAERCRHFGRFIEQIEPLDRPTVIVMPRPYHEVHGLHFQHRRFKDDVWYVLKENEAQARALPELQGFQWIEFVP